MPRSTNEHSLFTTLFWMVSDPDAKDLEKLFEALRASDFPNVHLANTIFLQEGFLVLSAYKAYLDKHQLGEVRFTNFNDPNIAVQVGHFSVPLGIRSGFYRIYCRTSTTPLPGLLDAKSKTQWNQRKSPPMRSSLRRAQHTSRASGRRSSSRNHRDQA